VGEESAVDARRFRAAAAILLAAWILLVDQLARAQNVTVEPFITVLKSSHVLKPGQYQPFALALGTPCILVVEAFTAAGIERNFAVRVTDGPNFEKLKRGQPFNELLGKSVLMVGAASHALPRHEFSIPQAGQYYLVLDNRTGTLFAQKIDVLAYVVPPVPTDGSRAMESSLSRFYAELRKSYVFNDFRIRMERCEQINAYSNPDIKLCHELAQDTIGNKLPGALTFLLFHEFGHSLLTLWGDPKAANEDVADQVATALLIMAGRTGEALEAVQWLRRQDSLSGALAWLFFSDPHLPSAQRAKNIEARLAEADRFARAWHTYFIPHTRTEVLKAIEADPKPWADMEALRAELARR
jgi:hypothetical protein